MLTDAFADLQAKVADLMYQVQDAAEEVRDARDDLSYSADELEQIESRLDIIHRLRKKYGTTCQDILYLHQLRKPPYMEHNQYNQYPQAS